MYSMAYCTTVTKNDYSRQMKKKMKNRRRRTEEGRIASHFVVIDLRQ
jgi:hypothetical protein